jgi:hypothetical protein
MLFLYHVCRDIFVTKNPKVRGFLFLGFPYSATEDNLAPHRSLVIHTAREFYNKARYSILPQFRLVYVWPGGY